MILINLAIASIIFDIICIYDNHYNILLIKRDNNNKNISICFNSSDPISYKNNIQQLKALFSKNDYCYYFDAFWLQCCEYLPFNFTFSFKIKSSQIRQYTTFCSSNNNNNDDYGYKTSRPCLVLFYITQNKQIPKYYKIPIRLAVKKGFYKALECQLFSKNKQLSLDKYYIYIKNGKCQ